MKKAFKNIGVSALSLVAVCVLAVIVLNNDDNRTFAHELEHSGGLSHTMGVKDLMTQKRVIQKNDGDYLKATHLKHSQIKTIRDNYIHNKLNRHILNWRQKLKKR